jgi:pterin-4a-carbinolamine dehydratase
METPAGWTNDGAALVKIFDRKDFDGSIAFVNAVAKIATWSHDVNAITGRDVKLAQAIDAL